MQFDLAHPPKFPSLPDLGRGSSRSNHWLRIVVYAVLAVVLLWALLWSRVQSKKIAREATESNAAYAAEVRAGFETAISTSSLDAMQLTVKGMALVAKDPTVASLLLEGASAKDPKYRDAAVGAGFAELAIADPLWVTDAQTAHDHTQIAQRYLEAAAAIDPIHAKTFELLVVAYGNLGQTEQASQAATKAKTFAIQS